MLLLAVVGIVNLVSCEKINNDSLKGFTVLIDLGEYGKWNTYGVHALGDYRFFNRFKGIPSNFPYNVNTYTGFGGVLLFMGQDMTSGGPVPLAFDMACPVEHDTNVTVTIDDATLEAVCPKCKSRYNVLLGAGAPISGMAIDRKVGLNMYRVHPTVNGGYLISNY